MFELVIFGTNYGLQTADKAIIGFMKVALWYFGPFQAKRHLEMMDTLVFFSENFTLFEIWRFWGSLCGRNEARNRLFKLSLVNAC